MLIPVDTQTLDYNAIMVAIIVSILSPIIVKLFEFIISSRTKADEEKKNKLNSLEQKLSLISTDYENMKLLNEKNLNALENTWQKKFDDMEEAYQRKIDALKEDNTQLRINIMALEISSKQKDDTIARLQVEVEELRRKMPRNA